MHTRGESKWRGIEGHRVFMEMVSIEVNGFI